MASQNRSHGRPPNRVTVYKTCVEIIRIILILLIWDYGFCLVTSLFGPCSAASQTIPIPVAASRLPMAPIAGDWNFAAHVNDPNDGLLPLPAGARTLCNRIGPDNTVQMEIVTMNSTRKQLLDLWRSKGWTIYPAPHERAGTFAYYCGRGNEFVYTWSACQGNRIETLILVNSPNSENTLLLARKNS